MATTHPLEHLEAVLIVGIGGFAGSNLRYFVETVVPTSMTATAIVNVLGSFALGFLLYEKIFSNTISQRSRTILATGFLASFTTYSTFVIDAIRAEPALALGYVLGSYALGFGAVVVGREGARWVTGTISTASEVPE